jgi:hypothetical protein
MATSAVEQLRLDLGAVIPEQAEGDQPEVDIIASVLDFYLRVSANPGQGFQ